MAFACRFVLCIAVVASLTIGASASYGKASNPLFTQGPVKQTRDLNVLPPWKRILEFKSVSTEHDDYSIQMWRKLLISLKDEPPKDQMYKANLWLNSFPYKQDNWIYGKNDHWSTPTEFLTKGGDCEDFAIAKYITLRELGFEVSSLKISIVYDVFSGTDHAFLLVTHGDEEFVLDNRDHIIEAEHYKDRYQPYYAFNEEQITTYEKPLIARTIRDEENNTVLPGNR